MLSDLVYLSILISPCGMRFLLTECHKLRQVGLASKAAGYRLTFVTARLVLGWSLTVM